LLRCSWSEADQDCWECQAPGTPNIVYHGESDRVQTDSELLRGAYGSQAPHQFTGGTDRFTQLVPNPVRSLGTGKPPSQD